MARSSSEKSRRVLWGPADQPASLRSMEKSRGKASESSGNGLLGTVKEEKVTGNSQRGFTQGGAFGIANGTQPCLSFLRQQLSLLTNNSLFHSAKQKPTTNLLPVYTVLFTDSCSVLKEQNDQASGHHEGGVGDWEQSPRV